MNYSSLQKKWGAEGSKPPPPHISDHPGQLLDAHLAGRGVVGYSGSSWFLFPIDFTCEGGGGRLLDAHSDGPGVVGYSGMDGQRALVAYMGAGFMSRCEPWPLRLW